MDIDAEKHAKESEIRAIETYLDQPISKEVRQDNLEEQEGTINLILNRQVDSLAALVAHFEAVGYLKGLRRSNSVLHDSLVVLKTEIQELNS